MLAALCRNELSLIFFGQEKGKNEFKMFTLLSTGDLNSGNTGVSAITITGILEKFKNSY